eukprot:2820491-Amphidinium_carterae.2
MKYQYYNNKDHKFVQEGDENESEEGSQSQSQSTYSNNASTSTSYRRGNATAKYGKKTTTTINIHILSIRTYYTTSDTTIHRTS